MGGVVADTGPIYYLVLIGCVDVLPALFGRLLIPPAVQAELTHEETPEKVRNWMTRAPAWLEVHATPDAPLRDDPQFEKLDAGEAAVINLAWTVEASLLLMDDRKAVSYARKVGFSVTGTLGVLERAADKSNLDLRAALSRLTDTNFYCSREIVDALLARRGDEECPG